MSMFALLVGLGPLLGWGLYPTIASKIGGRPVNQILGSTFGTLLFAGVVLIVNQVSFPTGKNLIFAILSGVGWGCAQIFTFKSFTLVGSSRVMPITTAFQLLGASLWGVLALGNWPGVMAKVLGAVALILIIIGASMTVWSEKKSASDQKLLQQAIILLAIGEIGYWAYSAAPQATNITGMEAFLPQAMGMFLVALIYAIVLAGKGEKFAILETVSYQHIFSGLFFAFAALTYLISAQPNVNGLATGFILSQTSVILGTLTGIWFLNQKKTGKEMTVTLIGLALILVAAAITVLI
ncbi:ribose transporter RbsU [Lactobacillus sp. DCY120]|uniref:Ribose transporter RbsU n=1 Tax=Bombilactobacillus apium TaxID=2675299 RepID=A0A850R2I6_9LACO|nr:GRP family sugar transporter [Bombilactobacillus apium]NVY96560.1 ribose transporter RbsU [Bombilactobacillus apium]